jgi:hypothetical protein
MERYLNATLGNNYRFTLNCAPWKSDSRTIEIGGNPPEEAEVIARSIMVPLPAGNTTNARLERWY